MKRRDRSLPADKRRLFLPMALVSIVILFGGASRPDVAAHSLTRAVSILALGWFFLHMNWRHLRDMRVPILLMASWFALIGLQLVPLPSALWAMLPGRSAFAEVYNNLGMIGIWRPLSFTPNATRNAFFAALVPLAVLIAAARLRERDWPIFVQLLLVIIAMSAVLGIAQMASQTRALYFYSVTNEGSIVGIFANRNHQSMLLATAFPLLAAFAAIAKDKGSTQIFHRNLAIACTVVLFLLIVATGSRAGLALMVIGAIGGILVYRSDKSQQVLPVRRDRRWWGAAKPAWLAVALIGILAILGVVATLLPNAEAIERLLSQDVSQEIRLRLFPVILQVAMEYLPWGTGFGSFDTIFRMHEPLENLSPIYINHAHNDLLEIVLEGGLPAVGLIVGFLTWAGLRCDVAWRRPIGGITQTQRLQRAGSIVLVILLLGSLADYPLRTPALAAVLAVAVTMLAQRSREEGEVWVDGVENSVYAGEPSVETP